MSIYGIPDPTDPKSAGREPDALSNLREDMQPDTAWRNKLPNGKCRMLRAVSAQGWEGRLTPPELGNFTHLTWRGQHEQVLHGAGRLREPCVPKMEQSQQTEALTVQEQVGVRQPSGPGR